MSKQIHAEVTAKIIEQLKAGVAPWVRPWSTTPGAFPRNLVSKRRYNGINVLLLMFAGAQYPTSEWATYKQIQGAGGQVRRGEKATQIVFFTKLSVEDRNDRSKIKSIPLLRYFSVFNHAQADWPEAEPVVNSADVSGDDTVVSADDVITATGASIRHGGNSAFFVPSADFIQIPVKGSFNTAGHYYATVFHELVHWTGHASRLARQYGERFGDPAYAFEELVAELGAAFLCAEHAIDGELRHAEYLGHWLNCLQSDEQAIFKAAAFAQKAVDLIAGRPAAGAVEQLKEAA